MGSNVGWILLAYLRNGSSYVLANMNKEASLVFAKIFAL